MKHKALMAIVAIATLLLDQLTKWLVVTRMQPNQSWAPVPALANIFAITYTTNTGVAFGLFRDQGVVLVVIALSLLAVLALYHHYADSEQAPPQTLRPIIVVVATLVGGVESALGIAIAWIESALKIIINPMRAFVAARLPRCLTGSTPLDNFFKRLTQALLGVAQRDWLPDATLGLVVAGALGNVIDRLRFGGQVIDFIDFKHWPVFNVADSAIVISMVLLSLLLWSQAVTESQARPAGQHESSSALHLPPEA